MGTMRWGRGGLRLVEDPLQVQVTGESRSREFVLSQGVLQAQRMLQQHTYTVVASTTAHLWETSAPQRPFPDFLPSCSKWTGLWSSAKFAKGAPKSGGV